MSSSHEIEKKRALQKRSRANQYHTIFEIRADKVSIWSKSKVARHADQTTFFNTSDISEPRWNTVSLLWQITVHLLLWKTVSKCFHSNHTQGSGLPVLLELLILLYIQPRAFYKKMEDWLQCLWHSQVRKWFHFSSSVVYFLADDQPEDPTHISNIQIFWKDPTRRKCQFVCIVKTSLPVTERLGTSIVK